MIGRRLLLLVSAVVMAETLFFTALAPLLPQLTHEFALSATGAGVLSGAYPAGGTIGAFAGAWLATRLGVRPTTVVGLLVLSACCAGFGLAQDLWALDALRFVQGAGGAVAWTGALAWLASDTEAERRGEVLGIALGAAVAGSLLGPLVGGAARLTGRPAAFVVFALPGVALALLAARMPADAPGRRQPLALMLRAFRTRGVSAGFWLVALPSILFGALTVLGPLSLDREGVGALGLTAVWVGGAVLAALASPVLGRWSDRRGRLEPVRVGLIGSLAVSLTIPLAADRMTLIALILVATVAYNVFWVPGGALLADAAEAHGLEHGLSFGLFNLAWAPAGALGSVMVGVFADRLGNTTSYVVLAGLCATTLLLLTRGRMTVAEHAPLDFKQP